MINAALLNFNFILHYYLFFPKESFFRMFTFQWIQYWNVFIFFWLRKGPSITYYPFKYVRNCMGNMGHPTAVYRGRWCHVLCVRAHLHYLFSYFWQHFCLIVSRFYCRNLTLPLFRKDVLNTNSYFSLTSSWHKPFSLKNNFVIKVSQNVFNFNQTES